MSLAKISRGVGPALVVASLLSGCTPLMRATGETLQAALAGPAPLTIDREQVRAIPYDQLRLDSPYGSAVLVLGRVADGQQYWVAASGQVLVVENGLVRRNTGFPQRLEGARFVGADPFALGLHRLPDQATAERIVDWGPGYRYGVHVYSRFSRMGSERIEILGDSRQVLVVREEWSAPAAGISGSNRYWVAADDGSVIRSEQQLTPDLRVTLTALRISSESARR